VLKPEMVKSMAAQPLILALANPDARDPPELARGARPTHHRHRAQRLPEPGQQRPVLPYIFRGALDCGATTITEAMKLACVRHRRAGQGRAATRWPAAYAGRTLSFGPEYLIPKPFDPRLILRIAPAVAQAAAESGVATRPIADLDAYREKPADASSTPDRH
jgi:malate dehydrogenase (oxaloacetate-decarboxylating)(NADP+)